MYDSLQDPTIEIKLTTSEEFFILISKIYINEQMFEESHLLQISNFPQFNVWNIHITKIMKEQKICFRMKPVVVNKTLTEEVYESCYIAIIPNEKKIEFICDRIDVVILNGILLINALYLHSQSDMLEQED